MKALVNRLKEPSTWSAIFTALAAVGISMPEGLAQLVIGAGAGVAALLAFFLPEGAKA